MTNDNFHPFFDESELSSDDLAILKAFDSMNWDESASEPDEEMLPPVQRLAPEDDANFLREMRVLFVEEAGEDLATMQRVWHQLENAGSISAEQFFPLRRGGHKIRGSAGAVNCFSMATIAGYIEDIAEQVVQGQLSPTLGLLALSPSLTALEETLQSVVAGSEDETPLARLTPPLKVLTYDSSPAAAPPQAVVETRPPLPEPDLLSSLLFPEAQTSSTSTEMPFLRVEPFRVEQLLMHSQQLTELRATLENSQTQVTQALQELHRAQVRLRQLQPMLSTLSASVPRSPLLEEQSSSSLISRILAQAEQRGTHDRLRKLKGPARGLPGTPGVVLWDELDMEHYSEQDLFLRSLAEAIADVSLSSARVQLACEQRELMLQQYLHQAAQVHNGVLQLRLVPLRLLLPELRQFIQLFSAQNQPLEFDVQGETVEVDQAVLDTLARPLLQLFQICLADATISLGNGERPQPARSWLHAQQLGNEVALEIGFSMPVSGGALESIREPLQRINGSFSLGRNPANGVSFYFRFPRAQGAAHCLLVRVGSEHFVVPAAQVQKISDYQYETLSMLYDLGTLLGLAPGSNADQQRVHPVLILPTANSPVLVGVKVDEVIDEVELAMKPLPRYLQRPGIAFSATDGKGNVLLFLDLPELIRHYSLYGQKAPMPVREDAALPQRSGTATVLIADDSVSMRQSLRQMLSWAQYNVLEARDGMVALEQLLEHVPDVLLLDIEMPNLNGYDLLRAMRAYPQLAHVKTVVLTSRSSEKHKGQARALGAHLYLTKPVVSDVLLSTIKELLATP